MTRSNQINMTEGPIFSKLLKFSIPLILSSVLQLLFNAADVVVVGRFAGDNSLAAVGSTGSLVNLLINLFMGLSVGTNVVAANYFGAKKPEELQDTVHTAILVSIFALLRNSPTESYRVLSAISPKTIHLRPSEPLS